jgi:hydroxymethylpyrimidine pyrophosphatase-like HAD family hydrolase
VLIFSDVDGTLLDDTGRCPLPLATLHAAGLRHEVVLASSRERSELHPLQHEWKFHSWCIAEDGGVIAHADGEPEVLGVTRPELLARMSAALTHAEQVALLNSEPRAAQGRLASLLLPIGVITPKLRHLLEAVGLRVTAGGRWATVTAGTHKGFAAGRIGERLGVRRWAAIGNAANDATLLGEAWRAFVIRNPEGHDPVLSRIDGAQLLAAPGPDGWLEMLELLEQPPGDLPEKESHDDRTAVDRHRPHDSRP